MSLRTSTCVAALATCAALLAGGCSLLDLSGGPGSRPTGAPDTTPAQVQHVTPQGFVPVTAGRIKLALPPAWKRDDRPPQGWSYAGILQSRAVVFGRAGVITKVAQTPDARIVAMSSMSSFQLTTPRTRRGSNRPIKLPGATSAVRVDYTFETPDERTGRNVRSQGTDIAIVYDSGKGNGSTTAAVVRVYGLGNAVTPQLLDQVMGTIEVAP